MGLQAPVARVAVLPSLAGLPEVSAHFGRFKVTEQGEVIYARYGNLAIGHRHLEQVTNAVLGASTPVAQAAVAAAEDRYLPTATAMAARARSVACWPTA